MGSVDDHYQNFLAQHYTWMSGGFEQKRTENLRFFESLLVKPGAHAMALDLGCGSGFQTAALLSIGYGVVAVDSSGQLIGELRQHLSDVHLIAMAADLRDVSAYTKHGPFEVAVCMGDTLVHLSSWDDVANVLRDVFANLTPDGLLVLGFRDLTSELKGSDRAIPVRLDEHQLMTTFLEYEPEHVVVNDMLFLFENGRWTMSKSSYRKLRLAPAMVVEQLQQIGFRSVEAKSDRGFCTIVARR